MMDDEMTQDDGMGGDAAPAEGGDDMGSPSPDAAPAEGGDDAGMPAPEGDDAGAGM